MDYAFLREIYNMVPRMQLYMDCLVERHHISFWAKDITLIKWPDCYGMLIHSTLSRTNLEKGSNCLEYIRILMNISIIYLWRWDTLYSVIQGHLDLCYILVSKSKSELSMMVRPLWILAPDSPVSSYSSSWLEIQGGGGRLESLFNPSLFLSSCYIKSSL